MRFSIETQAVSHLSLTVSCTSLIGWRRFIKLFIPFQMLCYFQRQCSTIVKLRRPLRWSHISVYSKCVKTFWWFLCSMACMHNPRPVGRILLAKTLNLRARMRVMLYLIYRGPRTDFEFRIDIFPRLFYTGGISCYGKLSPWKGSYIHDLVTRSIKFVS